MDRFEFRQSRFQNFDFRCVRKCFLEICASFLKISRALVIVAQLNIGRPVVGFEIDRALQLRHREMSSAQADQILTLLGEDLRQQDKFRRRALDDVVILDNRVVQVELAVLRGAREKNRTIGFYQSSAVMVHRVKRSAHYRTPSFDFFLISASRNDITKDYCVNAIPRQQGHLSGITRVYAVGVSRRSGGINRYGED